MDVRLGMVESRFADIIWENEPLTTRELIALCEKELNWKRTTTYTVLKKLCQRGIFAVSEQKVTAVLSRQDFHSIQSEQFISDHFSGSLPAFLAAFTARKPLSEKELAAIRELLDSYGGDGT